MQSPDFGVRGFKSEFSELPPWGHALKCHHSFPLKRASHSFWRGLSPRDGRVLQVEGDPTERIVPISPGQRDLPPKGVHSQTILVLRYFSAELFPVPMKRQLPCSPQGVTRQFWKALNEYRVDISGIFLNKRSRWTQNSSIFSSSSFAEFP